MFDLAASSNRFDLNLLAELVFEEQLTTLFNINQLNFALEFVGRVLGMHKGEIK